MNAIKKTKSKRLFSMLLALMMCLTYAADYCMGGGRTH